MSDGCGRQWVRNEEAPRLLTDGGEHVEEGGRGLGPIPGAGDPAGGAALQEAVKSGRNGRGTIFVWAAGNGGKKGDNSNYDGFANRRETIAVTAFTNFDEPAPYAEGGANVLVAAPSSGGSLAVMRCGLASSTPSR